MLSILIYYVGLLLVAYLALTMTLGSAMGVFQEAKIWAPEGLPSLSIFGVLKVFLFNLVWFTICFLGSIIVCIRWILTLGTSDLALEMNRWVEHWAAVIIIRCFVGDVQVMGEENLPEPNMVPAPVYISNHASQMDAASVYFFNRRFLWVAKSSVLFLPGVGGVMYLGGHVLIKRSGKNKKSVSNLYEKSNEAIQKGLPMFFFPQGTRSQAERLAFKDGAFIVAQTNKSMIVPISLEMPKKGWNTAYPFSLLWNQCPEVRLTIHKPIQVTGTEDREALKQQCADVIYSVLPPPPGSGSKKEK
ncbi:hypothetical protein MPSEU_000808600 [Mayamaea pseudoterrestris]|nr:hypothetical protein MPSEU_000808600 [Mayamaea pseudoterrestris]